LDGRVWEKECEGEEEQRKEKEGHEAREREFPVGARVGIGTWEGFFVVTGVAPVPLHLLLPSHPNAVLSSVSYSYTTFHFQIPSITITPLIMPQHKF